MIEFIYNEPTLREIENQMKKLNSKGFTCYFEGRGDGFVRLIVEDNKLTMGGYNDK